MVLHFCFDVGAMFFTHGTTVLRSRFGTASWNDDYPCVFACSGTFYSLEKRSRWTRTKYAGERTTKIEWRENTNQSANVVVEHLCVQEFCILTPVEDVHRNSRGATTRSWWPAMASLRAVLHRNVALRSLAMILLAPDATLLRRRSPVERASRNFDIQLTSLRFLKGKYPPVTRSRCFNILTSDSDGCLSLCARRSSGMASKRNPFDLIGVCHIQFWPS